MASFSTTELNATIDEIWNKSIEEARYASGVLLNRIQNRSSDVSKSGDKINFTVKSVYTVGDVGSNGLCAAQVITPTSVQLIVNQFKQITIETEDLAKAQSFWDPESDIAKDAGAAFAAYFDTAIAGQYSSFTNIAEVGASADPSAFDKTKMLSSMLKLADKNIPRSDLSFWLPPIAFYGGILTEVQLTSADQAGMPKNVLTTNYRFPLLGVPAYESTTLATVGTARKGMLIHKSAMAIAFQKNNTIKRSDRTAALYATSVCLVLSLYGIKVIRDDHGVVINVAAT